MSIVRRFLPLLLAACARSHGTEPPFLPPVWIELPGFQSVFDVPASVTRGTSFPVTYAVFGSSSCTRFRPPETSAGLDFLLIIPRLEPVPAGTACTDDLATVRQTITLTWFGNRSDFRVLLRGTRADGTGVELSRQVVAR